MKFGERVAIAIMSLWGLFAAHQLVNAMFTAHHWKGMSAGDWGTWIGSIGTVGAMIGTIWLATAETRRRTAAALDLATLAASSIVLRTARLNSAIRASIETLSHGLEGRDRIRGFQYCIDALSTAERWTIDELTPLVPLPNHAAAKLALVNQMLVTIELVLTRARANPLRFAADQERELIRQLHLAHGTLNEGIVECKKLAYQLDIRVDD